MDDLLIRKNGWSEVVKTNSILQAEKKSCLKQQSQVIIKTITKKVPKFPMVEKFPNHDNEGSLAVINLNEEDCNAEEKLIKNNLTVITNYFSKPDGQMHFISADMKSISVPSNTVLENDEEEAVGTALTDVYNIRIDEGCDTDVTEGSHDDKEDLYLEFENNPEQGNKIKVDKDDPCSRLHFIKFLRKEGQANMRIYQCGICGKEFKHQYTLLRHVTMHTDEKNYKCDDCGKTFRLMSTLSQHRAIHKTTRPYVCGVCKKTFCRVSTLISHKKIHFEEKRHQCSICNKSFHQKEFTSSEAINFSKRSNLFLPSSLAQGKAHLPAKTLPY